MTVTRGPFLRAAVIRPEHLSRHRQTPSQCAHRAWHTHQLDHFRIHIALDEAQPSSSLDLASKNCMKSFFARRLQSWSLITMLVFTWRPSAQAEPIPVRHLEGTAHGLLELRSDDGRVLASGDSVQVVHGDQITTRTLFNFKDGSVDDETTVFAQRRAFHLITDHHIQKGPSFPHPMDVLIDSRSGMVTVRSTGKDGKQEVITQRVAMPPDLANGMVPLAVENMLPNAPETAVSMLVATPKLRLVKLAISSLGEETFSVAGSPRKAIHYEIKIELGGVAGAVAPLIGKKPPNIQLWIVGGQAPTFIREQGPIYAEGPMMTIQLAGPVWPDSPKSGN